MLKKSRYTIAVDDEDGSVLLYNTANGAFGVFGADAHEVLEDPQEGSASLVGELERAGFLTHATPEEELAAQREAFESQRANHDELMLVLAPTYACNYRCPYCYEKGHNSIPGIMDDKVIEAVYDFIADRYEEHPFVRLSVQWYGGDPSLALDVVAQMSEWMMSWCSKRDVEYSALMLTNCNLIDEDAAALLARCQVKNVLITIDGFEETHNKRRVAANGSNSFQRNVSAARLLRAQGIGVTATMNVDRVNWPEYHDLRDWLRDEIGVELSCGRLCDYGHFFGSQGFAQPTFDLFTHKEFSELEQREFEAAGYGPLMYRVRLAPAPRFCNGQRADYYIIDSVGDIYACDGRIGERDYVVGSVFEKLTEGQRNLVSHDPYESGQCRACELLPLCQGNCRWERELTGMQCHPLKYTLPDYLRAWRAACAR